MMKYYHYAADNTVIRVKASRRPSEKTKPKSGTWIVHERNNCNWEMPCFPEITWGILKTLEYIGCISVEQMTTPTIERRG